jgi:hypothetical protein
MLAAMSSPYLRASIALALASSMAGCPGPEVQPDAAVAPMADAGADAPAEPDAFVADPYPAECENLNPLHCLAPWPSDRWLVDDPSTRTGRRLGALTQAAIPPNRRTIRADPAQWNAMDGFSPATSMVTVFDEALDTSVLADERHIEDSLAADSRTVVLEIPESGEPVRIAHFAEIDTWGDVDPSLVPFYIRPATRLRPRTRYVVAIRNLTTAAGAPVEPSDYFRALRDESPLPEAEDLEARRAHFEDIFTILEGAGVTRASLLEAWDFTTASDESLYTDMVTIRDEAIRQNDMAGNCRITVNTIEEMPDANVYRRMEGTIRVPLFVNGTEPGGATAESVNQSRLHRDAMGRPTQNDEIPFAEVPFTATIPTSVYEAVRSGGPPARLLTYGHGLFGDRGETYSGWFRDTIEELQMVGIAVDWWGMSGDDVLRVTRSLGEFSSFVATPERLEQGLLNFVILTHSFINAGLDRCEIVGTAAVPEPLHIAPLAGGDAVLSYDPNERYYYGNSQGGIMGLALAGISTDITRFVSGVGGMSYSVMIPRSTNWQVYGAIMGNSYPRQIDRAILMTMAQSQWDFGEPSTYAAFIHEGNTLPCSLGDTYCPGGVTPGHHVLMMIGQDDAQVANITADTAARTVGGVPVLVPSPYMPYGLETTTGSDKGTQVLDALAIFAIPGTPMLPLGTRDPVDDNPAHEGVRRSAAGHRMMDIYWHPDGVIEQTCDGVCDPD